MCMGTDSDLFQYSLVIIGIVGLIMQIFKKKYPSGRNPDGYCTNSNLRGKPF